MVVTVAMVVVGPAVVISVIVMLELMRRRAMMLDDDGTSMFLVHGAVVIVEMDFPAIDVPHVDLIDVPSGGVVEEVVPTPFATLKASSGVTVSIADSTVVTDVRAPIAGVKAVVAAFPTPVGWCP